MNKSRTVMSSLAAIWAVGGFAASVVTKGTVTTLDVPEGETYVYEEALAAPTTQFVKTGAGTARFETAAPAYTGEILIQEGVADFTVPKAYGTGPITVLDGAQLVVSHASEGQDATSVAGTVTVAGSGPDGSGAIRFTGSGMGDCLFAKLVLAGDATIGGNRHGYKTIDFQHHVFTWVGGNLMVNGHTWMNFEKLVHNGTADICFQGWHGIDQSAAGKPIVIVNDRAHISFWDSTEPIPYALVYDASSSLRVNAGDAVKWAGPITVAAGKTLEIQTNKVGKGRKITLSGKVGGEGAVAIGGDQDGTVVFDNPANTWTGGYVQKRSTVQVRAPGSLPGYDVPGRVSVTGGTLELMHATGWTVDDAKAVEANAALGTGGTLAFNPGGETVAPGLGTRKDVTYAFTGPGTARLPEVLCDDGKFLGNGADVVLGGESAVARRLTWFRVRGGTTTLDGVDLHVTNTWNREFTIGGAGAETARLVLTNGARMLVLNAPLPLVPPKDDISLPTTYVGGTGTGPAVVELNDGCALTGRVSAVAGGRSVWNIRGGELVDVTGPVSDGYLSFGQNGYAYIDQTGGRFLGRAHSGLMRGGSTGIYHLRGGTFGYIPGQTGTCNFTLSRGDGMGVLHQTGGVHDTPDKSLYMGIQDYSDPAGGLAVATLDGPNALMKVGSVDLGRRLTNFTAIVNLMNGGVLNTKAISHAVAAERVNTHGYVNFNGGVFRAAGANTDVFGPDGRRPARVTVFRKGAVFDTAGFDCGLGAPGLAAPSGKGVEKIEIPDSAKRTGYYGSPEVVITGDGTGATAFCEFDAATGTIGPITVTCPGWDYTTATATIRTADRTDTVALAVTLATQTGGGLVKLGANTLTLNGVHTYAGETVVSNGTLRLGTAGAFPQGNDLRLAGGMFDGAGQTVTAGVVRVTSGVLRNVRLVCTRLEKTGEGTLEFEQAELVECGSLSLVGGLKSVCRPGLFEDVLSGQENWTGVIACTNVQSQGPVKANTKEGWTDNTTAVYAGYIWNRTDADVTWSLMESFDDRVRVWIDGGLLLSNDAWDAASAAAFTLAPGPHRFEARFGQGGGGAGPASATNIVGNVQPTFGIGLDWKGRTDLLAANFTALANPEVNGEPLFTTAPGALPLADPTATTATLTGPFAFTGTWTVDMAQIRAGGRLAVTDGALDLSAVTEVVFANTEDLKKGGVYVLAESADGFVLGETPPALAGLPAGPWRLEVYGKTLRLAYPASTAIILR